MKKSVLFIHRIFPLYRKPIYDLIHEQLDIKVLSASNKSGIKQAQTDYSEFIPAYQYAKNNTSMLLFPARKIIKYRPKVVILELAMGMINLPIIILFCKMMGIKVALWSHGYNRKTGFNPEKKRVDKFRLWLLKWVDAIIIYSQSDKKYLAKYLDPNKIFVAQNTLDTPTLNSIRDELVLEGKLGVKKRLGIQQEYNILFIGRLLASKKPDLLLDIYEILKNKYQFNIGVHFIGNGERFASIKERIEANFDTQDFYLHGAIHDNEKSGELLFASDLMVLPGAAGLSINHAFCFDCPVVSFAAKNWDPAHGPEIEYLINEETGFLLDKHTPEELASVIYKYLNDENLQKKFLYNIRHQVENVFPIEKMVAGVVDCIDYLKTGNHN